MRYRDILKQHYFEPIVIGNECVIHSSFHQNVPKANYDIVIDPKMAFGTGHHETTSLVIGEILKMDLVGKTILDMGCGTAVLAIPASMCGAKKILTMMTFRTDTPSTCGIVELDGRGVVIGFHEKVASCLMLIMERYFS